MVKFENELLGKLLFYLGNKYQSEYGVLLRGQFVDDELIVSHKLPCDGDYGVEFKHFMNCVSEWIGCEECFDGVVVSRLELDLPWVFVHFSVNL